MNTVIFIHKAQEGRNSITMSKHISWTIIAIMKKMINNVIEHLIHHSTYVIM